MQLHQAIAILELADYRSADDLKAAFRTLAHRYHPDKNPGRDTTVMFRDVMHAYHFCLEHLDELAHHFFAPPPPAGFDPATVIANTEDIFAEMFGMLGQGRLFGFRPAETIRLPLEALAHGGDIMLRVTAYISCASCRGSGAASGGKSRLCRQCFGFGSSLRRVGGAEQRQPCPACAGRGREIDSPCSACDGHGVMPRRGKYRVRLPPLLSPRGRYTAATADAIGNPIGYAVITPVLKRDKIFQIENCDLLCEYYTDLPPANSARSRTIATPFGEVTAVIPLDAADGTKIRVSEAGLPTGEGTRRGDLLVTLRFHRKSFWQRLLACIPLKREDD